MPAVVIDNVPHAYDEAGQGPCLLLLHAGIADRGMWDEVVPALSERYRVVRPDLRGFGETPLPDGPYAYAADAANLLDALGIARAHVCGVSMGAGVALDLALSRPELVDRLVLVAAGLPGWDWSAEMQSFDEAEMAALEEGRLDDAAWLNVEFWLDGPTRSADQVDAGLRDRVFRMQRRALEMDNPNAVGSLLVDDHRARLDDVAAPTLVLLGELDQPEFAAIGRHLGDHMPDAHVHFLAGVAHLPPMEAPAAFAQLVADHLGS